LKILPLQGQISSYVFLTSPVKSITGFYLIDSLITGNWIAFKDVIIHMILPAITLSFASLAFIVRITRSSMIEVMTADYIRTAKAYGLGNKLIRYKYALKNGLIPVVTVTGLSYALKTSSTGRGWEDFCGSPLSTMIIPVSWGLRLSLPSFAAP
jgi:peptide/nickel transport system permease protein